MSKYTKGPWSLADENNQCCSVLLGIEHNLTCSLDRQDGNTGQVVIEREEMLANARLISAAPDLLKALQSYYLPIDMNNIAVSCIEFGNEAVEKELKRRAAIAKALGETS